MIASHVRGPHSNWAQVPCGEPSRWRRAGMHAHGNQTDLSASSTSPANPHHNSGKTGNPQEPQLLSFSSILLSPTDVWMQSDKALMMSVPSPSMPVEQEKHRGDWERLGRGRVPPMSGACSRSDTRTIGRSPYGLHRPEVRHEANSKDLKLMTPMILCTQSRSSQISF